MKIVPPQLFQGTAFEFVCNAGYYMYMWENWKLSLRQTIWAAALAVDLTKDSAVTAKFSWEQRDSHVRLSELPPCSNIFFERVDCMHLSIAFYSIAKCGKRPVGALHASDF